MIRKFVCIQPDQWDLWPEKEVENLFQDLFNTNPFYSDMFKVADDQNQAYFWSAAADLCEDEPRGLVLPVDLHQLKGKLESHDTIAHLANARAALLNAYLYVAAEYRRHHRSNISKSDVKWSEFQKKHKLPKVAVLVFNVAGTQQDIEQSLQNDFGLPSIGQSLEDLQNACALLDSQNQPTRTCLELFWANGRNESARPAALRGPVAFFACDGASSAKRRKSFWTSLGFGGRADPADDKKVSDLTVVVLNDLHPSKNKIPQNVVRRILTEVSDHGMVVLTYSVAEDGEDCLDQLREEIANIAQADIRICELAAPAMAEKLGETDRYVVVRRTDAPKEEQTPARRSVNLGAAA